MAADFLIEQRDNWPYFRVRLWNPDGSNPNLTGATVTFVLKSSGGTVVVNSTTVSVIDPVLAIVEYRWVGAGDTAAAGDYTAEWKVVMIDGTRRSYPDTPDHNSVSITASLV